MTFHRITLIRVWTEFERTYRKPSHCVVDDGVLDNSARYKLLTRAMRNRKNVKHRDKFFPVDIRFAERLDESLTMSE